MIRIAPSILSADFARLGEEIKAMEAAGADMIHIDVMDGRFVPNITVGIPVVRALRAVTSLVFDVHLMIEDPRPYISAFADAGTDVLTFHFEAEGNPGQVIHAIRAEGIKAGISIKPATPADKLYPLLDSVDQVLVMTVEPGFGGQTLLPETLDKVRQIKDQCRRAGCSPALEVDGGINLETAPLAAKAGADILVAGSSLYLSDDYRSGITALRNAVM